MLQFCFAALVSYSKPLARRFAAKVETGTGQFITCSQVISRILAKELVAADPLELYNTVRRVL